MKVKSLFSYSGKIDLSRIGLFSDLQVSTKNGISSQNFFHEPYGSNHLKKSSNKEIHSLVSKSKKEKNPGQLLKDLLCKLNKCFQLCWKYLNWLNG